MLACSYAGIWATKVWIRYRYPAASRSHVRRWRRPTASYWLSRLSVVAAAGLAVVPPAIILRWPVAFVPVFVALLVVLHLTRPMAPSAQPRRTSSADSEAMVEPVFL